MKRPLKLEEVNFLVKALQHFKESEGPSWVNVSNVRKSSIDLHHLQESLVGKGYLEFDITEDIHRFPTAEKDTDVWGVIFPKKFADILIPIIEGYTGDDIDFETGVDFYRHFLETWVDYCDLADLEQVIKALGQYTELLVNERDQMVTQMKCKGYAELREAIEDADMDWTEFLVDLTLDSNISTVPEHYLPLKEALDYRESAEPRDRKGDFNPLVRTLAKHDINIHTFKLDEFIKQIRGLRNKVLAVYTDYDMGIE